MSIEFKIQSVILRPEDIQEKFPDLIPSINYFLQNQNKPKKRRKKKRWKETVAVLIDDILADLNK